MNGPLEKVTPGTPLRIPASAYNAFVDAARAVQAGRFDSPADAIDFSFSPTIISVRNISGAFQAEKNILVIAEPIVAPADNEPEFLRSIKSDGDTPATAKAGKFVVLLGALDDGDIGDAVVAGGVFARIHVSAGVQDFAEITNANANYLTASATGSARILWQDTTSSATPRTPSSTDTSAETTTFGAAHGWVTGAMVTPSATGNGLTAGTVYYVRAVSSTAVAYYTNAADAANDTNRVNLTGSVTAEIQPIRWAMVRLGDPAPTVLTAFSGVRLRRTTTLSGSAFTVIPFPTEDFDTDNYHSTSVNPETITIPATGKYLIGGSAYHKGNYGANYNVTLSLTVGGISGTYYWRDAYGPFTAGGATVSYAVGIEELLSLTVGATLNLWFEAGAGEGGTSWGLSAFNNELDSANFWCYRVA